MTHSRKDTGIKTSRDISRQMPANLDSLNSITNPLAKKPLKHQRPKSSDKLSTHRVPASDKKKKKSELPPDFVLPEKKAPKRVTQKRTRNMLNV